MRTKGKFISWIMTMSLVTGMMPNVAFAQEELP